MGFVGKLDTKLQELQVTLDTTKPALYNQSVCHKNPEKHSMMTCFSQQISLASCLYQKQKRKRKRKYHLLEIWSGYNMEFIYLFIFVTYDEYYKLNWKRR